MEEEALTGDPPAYYSIFRPGNCPDTTNTSEVHVSDLHEEPLVAPSFENKSTRIVFIQKVLAIRCLQVAAASGIIAAVYHFGDLEYWLRGTLTYWVLTWSLVYSATVIALIYWKDVGKKTPYNYLFLVADTISTAFIWMVITTGFFNIKDGFFVAWLFYAALTLALLLYTVFILDTSQEFRLRDTCGLTCGLSILMIAVTASIVYSAFPYYDIFPIFYLTLLWLLICAHAVYRLQLITSGEYHRALTPADFISAALYSQIDLVRGFAN